ncbi:MAG: hypothetical protein ABJA71_14200 [Ginsengibacter sp.]
MKNINVNATTKARRAEIIIATFECGKLRTPKEQHLLKNNITLSGFRSICNYLFYNNIIRQGGLIAQQVKPIRFVILTAMKCFILNIIFLLPIYIFAQSLSDDTLHWSPYRQISWSDFKGDTIDLPNYSGECSIVILARFQKANLILPAKTVVETVFDRKNSWTNIHDKNSPALRYDQLLFDIYEVYARKLRQEYSQTRFGFNPNKIFNEKYNAMMSALSNRKKQLMKETKLGTDSGQIDLWAEQVKTELDSLNNYAEKK